MMNWKLVSLWILTAGCLMAGGYLAYETQKLEISAVATATAETTLIYPDLPLINLAPVPIFDGAEDCLADVVTATTTASTATTTSSNLSIEDINSAKTVLAPTDQLQACQVATYPNLSARSAYLLDLNSGTPLLSINAEAPLAPASVVKLMTALVTVKNYDLNQVLTVTANDLTQSNSLDLTAGEQFTVADLLQALLISSSNEAAQVLANNFPTGGATGFVAQMNQTATQLGLSATHFTSPEGFDHINQKTSASDLAILAQTALQNDYLASIMSLGQTSISSATGKIFDLTNTNYFLSAPMKVINSRSLLFACNFQKTKTDQVFITGEEETKNDFRLQSTMATTATSSCAPIFFGLKTGTTAQAGEVLVSAVTTPDNHDLLAVVMGSSQRYTDTVKILEWALKNYTWQTEIF